MALLVQELDAGLSNRPAWLDRLHGSGLPTPCTSLDQLARPRNVLDADERSALASTLESAIAPLQPPVAVLDSIRALKRPECSIVLSTATPSFLGSPLRSLYRALHAIALARSLSRAWRAPVIPTVWNDCDSPLTPEAQSMWLLNENFELERVGIPSSIEGHALRAFDDLGALESNLADVRDLLVRRFADDAFLEEALELLLPKSGESLARSFTRWLLALLGHQGLVVLEPDWHRPTYARASASLDQGDLERRFAHGAQAWKDAVRAEEKQLVDGANFPSSARLQLIQETCWPVSAIVGTWDDFTVHLKLDLARKGLGVAAPPFAPLLRCCLVDRKTRWALERCSMDAQDILSRRGESPRSGSRPRITNKGAAASLRLRSIAERAAMDLHACRQEILGLEPGLAAGLRRTAAQVREHIDRFAGKVERAGANLSGRTRSAERLAANMLLPRGLPQEEVHGPLSFLAAHGDSWPIELIDRIRPLPLAPLLVELQGPETS